MTDDDILTLLDRATRQHSAFLGKTGSGKTSTAKLAIETICRTQPRARVCILDPIKSDWWGITSSENGKKPGLPFSIIGGPKAHVPLHPDAGKILGKLVGQGTLRHTIIDMAEFGPGDLQRFYNAFAGALLSNMRGVLYLVLEEAHEFAPKEFSGIGDEARAVYHSKKLATAGRSKGIRLMVLTQRTQSLHNALLGSCESMFAHRLMAPADQAPVLKWLKANVDKERFATIEAGLSRLPNGTAWVISGEAQILEEVAFPRITTFDNTRTPEADDEDEDEDANPLDPVMAPVDLAHLADVIGVAAAEVAGTDPAMLRAEISRLQIELSRKPAAAVTAAPATDGHQAYQDGYKTGFMHGGERSYTFAWTGGYKQGREIGRRESAHRQFLKIAEGMAGAAIIAGDVDAMTHTLDKLRVIHIDEPPMPTFEDAPDHLRTPRIPAAGAYTPAPADAGMRVNAQTTIASETTVAAMPVQHIKHEGYFGTKSKASGTAMEKMLAALAELHALGIPNPRRELVAAMADYTNIQSRPIRDAFSAALASGSIVSFAPGTVALTDKGFGETPRIKAPMGLLDLHRRILSVLDTASQRALTVLIEVYPHAIERTSLALRCNYTNVQSRPIRDAFSKLIKDGFAHVAGPGTLAATTVLFPSVDDGAVRRASG